MVIIDKIFSGNNSRNIWKKINKAETIEDLKLALYTVTCKLQELESKIDKLKEVK